MAISPVKAYLKDSLASTIHTSVQGFVSRLRNTQPPNLQSLFHLQTNMLVIPSTLRSMKFTGASTHGLYASVCCPQCIRTPRSVDMR
ncbi:hypothetical protein ACFXTH_030340 [Malus domestica]